MKLYEFYIFVLIFMFVYCMLKNIFYHVNRSILIDIILIFVLSNIIAFFIYY